GGRGVLRAVPARLRQPSDVERGPAVPALQGVAQDLAPARLAGALGCRAVREQREVRPGRHVREGVPRRLDEGRHRHRGVPAQADLQGKVDTMAVRPEPPARSVAISGRTLSPRALPWRAGAFRWLMLAPGVVFLLAFVAYPFFYGIWLSLQQRQVAQAGTFVGLANFVTLYHDAVFWQVTGNTFVYVIVTTILKLAGGLAMALVINQAFRGRNLVRAALLLPFIVPTILSTVAWMWIFDPTFSVINWLLVHGGVIASGFSWLGNKTLAMVSIIIVNTWRGIPFYGITLLAGLQAISPHLYEAAA